MWGGGAERKPIQNALIGGLMINRNALVGGLCFNRNALGGGVLPDQGYSECGGGVRMREEAYMYTNTKGYREHRTVYLSIFVTKQIRAI